MPRKNAFYAQSGGVTAVINASACGVIETARQHKDRIGKVFAGLNGIIGALTEDLIDTGKESAAAIRGPGRFAPASPIPTTPSWRAANTGISTRAANTSIRRRPSLTKIRIPTASA